MIPIRQIPSYRILLVTGSLGLLALTGCAGVPAVLSPASPNAAMISNLFFFLFAIAVVVFIVVEFLLFYSVIRFRRGKKDGMPAQVYGNTKLEIAWTTIPAVVLGIVFILTWQTLSALATIPPNALNVKVTGHQWWWEVEYSDLGVITANEIHIPVGQSTLFTLESKDVIHSFWVPELGGKLDLIPGHTNRMWVHPTQVGTFIGQCAEFCGLSHANMRFVVMVDPTDQFNAWAARQKQTAAAPTTDQAKRGMQLVTTEGCQTCHTVNGTTAQGKLGPNLTHVASRKTIAAGLLPFSADSLRTWISDPPAVKPGSIMPKMPLDQAAINAIIAYLETLN